MSEGQVFRLHGAGLGLRRELMLPLLSRPDQPVDFLEVAPENWLELGGVFGKRFRALTERYPFVCHGLSLSIGGPAPLDEEFVRQVRRFLDLHNIRHYSEHLSFCADHGHLYDLLPIPFTEEAVAHVAARVMRVQDLLGRRIALENVSYYTPLAGEMSEQEFILAVLDAADCDLLLDVNNVYVNSINHGYDAAAFIAAMPPERIAWLHVAGHFDEADDLLVDTHGSNVKQAVWRLLADTYIDFGALPTLLERDFNIPPLDELLNEIAQIRLLQSLSHARGCDSPREEKPDEREGRRYARR